MDVLDVYFCDKEVATLIDQLSLTSHFVTRDFEVELFRRKLQNKWEGRWWAVFQDTSITGQNPRSGR